MRSLALLAVVTACWSAPPRTAPVSNVAPRTVGERVHDLPQHTVWSGAYTCAQGLTALTLTLDVTAAGDATAIFEFGPIEQNPDLPRGSYRMRGRLFPHESALELRLDPDSWVDQPPGYMMVGLDAALDRTRRYLDGRITEDRCGSLTLRRAY